MTDPSTQKQGVYQSAKDCPLGDAHGMASSHYNADDVRCCDFCGFPVDEQGADDPVEVPPGAIDALRNGQRQLDMDGSEVGVSRQALDELLAWYDARSHKEEKNDV